MKESKSAADHSGNLRVDLVNLTEVYQVASARAGSYSRRFNTNDRAKSQQEDMDEAFQFKLENSTLFMDLLHQVEQQKVVFISRAACRAQVDSTWWHEYTRNYLVTSSVWSCMTDVTKVGCRVAQQDQDNSRVPLRRRFISHLRNFWQTLCMPEATKSGERSQDFAELFFSAVQEARLKGSNLIVLAIHAEVTANNRTIGLDYKRAIQESFLTNLLEWIKLPSSAPGEELASRALESPSRLLCSATINRISLSTALRELMPHISNHEEDSISRFFEQCYHGRDYNPELPNKESRLRWDKSAHCSFLLNRAVSYIGLPEHQVGISALGGLSKGFCLAWASIYSAFAYSSVTIQFSVDERDGDDFFPLTSLTELLARQNNTEIRPESLNELDACLIQAKDRAIIYLKRDMPPIRQMLGILHELAHKILQHKPNTSYGLDIRRLNIQEVTEFEVQEQAANALASLWLHLLEGLVEIGLRLAGLTATTRRLPYERDSKQAS